MGYDLDFLARNQIAPGLDLVREYPPVAGLDPALLVLLEGDDTYPIGGWNKTYSSPTTDLTSVPSSPKCSTTCTPADSRAVILSLA